MNAKTTETAKRNPNTPSRTSLSIWRWMSGPWSVTTMISTSSGMPPMEARVSLTAVVTSRVFASAFLETLTERPGLPLVRDMLEGRPAPNDTSATSESRTGPDSLTPTTSPRSSSTESSVCVVFAITARCPSKSSPAGSVTLFSRRAASIWKMVTPLAAILSRSAATLTLRSTSPISWTCITPSISSISGMISSFTSSCTSGSGLSDTMPSWITGKASGVKRPTVGSSTEAGNATPFSAFSTWASAAAMSVPYRKVAKTADLPSDEVDWTVSRPSAPAIARSIGPVTSRATASGSAEGYDANTLTSGNSICGKSSTFRERYAYTPAASTMTMARRATVGRRSAVAVINVTRTDPASW